MLTLKGGIPGIWLLMRTRKGETMRNIFYILRFWIFTFGEYDHSSRLVILGKCVSLCKFQAMIAGGWFGNSYRILLTRSKRIMVILEYEGFIYLIKGGEGWYLIIILIC